MTTKFTKKERKMGGHKVVPMEPTREMLAAGKHALEVGCYASGIYADMLAAAPAVQGGPVAWLSLYLGWESKGRVELAEPYEKTTNPTYWTDAFPVYATPQPAEQRPNSHDWDDQDKCRRCGDRDWYASATCLPAGISVPPKEVIRQYADAADPSGEDLCAWSFRRGFESAIEYANQIRQQVKP